MECLSCKIVVSDDSFFCPTCGKKLRCTVCNSTLSVNAKFCTKCGESLVDLNHVTSSKNTAKYHRKGEEIYCEVSLNDEVAKDGIVSLFDNLTKSQQYRQLPSGEETNEIVIDERESELISTETFIKEHSKTIETQETESTFPHIKDIELILDCSEKEWILIYAFYESDYGTKNFTRKNVYDRYMSKRKTSIRMKNFNTYWNRLFKDYISTVNDKEFKFKQGMIGDVKNLILGQRKSTMKESSASSTKSATDTSTATKSAKPGNISKSKAIPVEKFDIFKSGTIMSLEDFLKAKSPGKGALSNTVVIGYYITIMKGAKTFSEGNIDYAYRTLSIPGRPNFLHQIMINAKNKQDYFEQTSGDGVWRLTRGGEIFVEEKLPRKSN